MAKFGSGAERVYQFIAPGVNELIPNKTLMIANVNEETAGEDVKNRVRCASIVDVAKTFKPKKTFSVKKIDDLTKKDSEIVESSITMDYSRNTSKVIDNFLDKNIVVKARDKNDEQILLQQRLQTKILDDLAEKLRDTKFQKSLSSKKAELIAALKDELDKLT